MIPPDLCPLCGADLTGEKIPESFRQQLYGDQTHYTRKLTDWHRGGTVTYRCPDCNGTWPVEGQ